MKGLAVPGEVAHGLGVAVLRGEEEVLEERHVARVGPGRLDQGARLAREEGVVALRALLAQDVDGEEDEHADLVVHGKRDEAVHLVVERRQRVEPGAEVRVQPLVARLGADVARGEAGRRQAAGRRGQDVQGQLAELDGLEKKGSGGPRMGLDRRERPARTSRSARRGGGRAPPGPGCRGARGSARTRRAAPAPHRGPGWRGSPGTCAPAGRPGRRTPPGASGRGGARRTRWGGRPCSAGSAPRSGCTSGRAAASWRARARSPSCPASGGARAATRSCAGRGGTTG